MTVRSFDPRRDLEPAEWIGRVDDLDKVPKWMRELIWHKRKEKCGAGQFDEWWEPQAIGANVIAILRGDLRWRTDGAPVLVYDEFFECIRKTRLPPWHENEAKGAKVGEWEEEDGTRLQSWLAHAYRLNVNEDTILRAVATVARRHVVHPVREYLTRVVWDKTPRLDTWLVDVFGVDDTPIHRAFGAKFLISAVARIMRPGCKVDTCLVLEGAQGIQKSTTLRFLVGDDWFLELHGDLSDKDTAQSLRGKWLGELAELASVRRTDVEQVKRFLSCPADRYRPSYGRVAKDFPRQCVFAGTTNAVGQGYLVDATGARRFWPITCRRADARLVRAIRDQLWAEAAERYQARERWWLSAEEDALADDTQDERFAVDEWERRIAAHVSGYQSVTVGDVLSGCLNLPIEKWTPADQIRVGRCMVSLGWVRRRTGPRSARCWKYYPSDPLGVLGGPTDQNSPGHEIVNDPTIVSHVLGDPEDQVLGERVENGQHCFADLLTDSPQGPLANSPEPGTGGTHDGN